MPIEGLEITEAITQKTSLRGVTSCSPVKVNAGLGGTYCFHLQGGEINQAIKKLLYLLFDHPKRR